MSTALQRLALPSNSGYKSLTVGVREVEAELFRCDVQFWSALPYLSETEEARVAAKDVVLSWVELLAFVLRIESWLTLPLNDMAVTPLDVVVDLGVTPFSSLNLDVQGGLLGHSSVSVDLDVHGVSANMVMQCDQSCWRLFCEAVRDLEEERGS
ncbi:MAG: hypothetical protein AAGF99_02970 [Bacteroidota bacterium]